MPLRGRFCGASSDCSRSAIRNLVAEPLLHDRLFGVLGADGWVHATRPRQRVAFRRLADAPCHAGEASVRRESSSSLGGRRWSHAWNVRVLDLRFKGANHRGTS